MEIMYSKNPIFFHFT